MKVSLIITTYNWPEALELCLLSILDQNRLPDEVIVADDGSSDETRLLVEKIASYAVVPIRHSWQEDKGFRAARSRNKAIVKSSCDYIIMVDGDVILDRNFIKDHIHQAKPGCFIQGSRVLLEEARTKEILRTGDTTFFFFSPGIDNRKNCIRSRFLTKIFSKNGNYLEGIRACNTSFWKKDALSINGFNEDFEGWGREDSEFACRLMNKGINRLNVKFMALVYHLFHPICKRDKLCRNDLILEKTEKNRLAWCENGIDKSERRQESAPPERSSKER